jgi:hypothetical protein
MRPLTQASGARQKWLRTREKTSEASPKRKQGKKKSLYFKAFL